MQKRQYKKIKSIAGIVHFHRDVICNVNYFYIKDICCLLTAFETVILHVRFILYCLLLFIVKIIIV